VWTFATRKLKQTTVKATSAAAATRAALLVSAKGMRNETTATGPSTAAATRAVRAVFHPSRQPGTCVPSRCTRGAKGQ